MKALLLALLAFPFPSWGAPNPADAKLPAFEVVTPPLVGDGHLQCFIQESKGRRSEKYEVRLNIPAKRAGEFALRLYPLMVVQVEAWVDKVPGRPLEINLTLLDNSIEEAELLWDLVHARAKGEERVSLFAKVEPQRGRTVRVECSREEAIER